MWRIARPNQRLLSVPPASSAAFHPLPSPSAAALLSLSRSCCAVHPQQHHVRADRGRSNRRMMHSATAVAASSSNPSSSLPPFVSSVDASSSSLRRSFLHYFQSQRHLLLPSSSLVPPSGDDTLLFTNAGMVQLKDMLLGLEPAPQASHGGRLVSVQKCMRAGGKHNDLENVGHTARHHTFFEMLGNFSIANYFKEEAMYLAWNFLTKELVMPPSRLRISIHQSDDESAALWKKISGFTEENGKLVRLGDADNFWSMGDAAGTPCGPCSEIFWDQGTEVDGDRWLEIWNLVFMQYARGKAAGELIPLAKPCVDTGMGLERLAAVMQNQPTNYDSDLLRPSIDALRHLVQARNPSQKLLAYTNGLDTSATTTALKVIVDHVRASSFLLAEGVVPSNLGRGYVLRRIIRRAIRFGTTIGLNEPFLSELVPSLITSLGHAYPELVQRQSTVTSLLRQEEQNFFQTLHRGIKVLDEAFAKNSSTGKVLPGELAFLLYDSYGFPLDLTSVIARERGATVDTNKFDQLMERQKEMSKGVGFSHGAASGNAAAPGAAKKLSPDLPLPVPSETKKWQHESITNTFVGYSQLDVADTQVLALHATQLAETGAAWLALAQSPFYANQGGQVGDIGSLTLSDGSKIRVVDCVKPYDGLSVVRVFVPLEEQERVKPLLSAGSKILHANVDRANRSQIAIHHTATHLLHAALKKVLGNEELAAVPASSSDKAAKKDKGGKSAPVLSAASINQAGSLVAADRLRFDFSCPVALTSAQLTQLEAWVNDAILEASTRAEQSAQISTKEMPKEEAMKMNAMSLFGEKYSNVVRVVSIPGYSLELCGGTHVSNIRDCYPFEIISESSIASGIRRIEAVAGPAAVRVFETAQGHLKKASSELKVQPENVSAAIVKMIARVKQLEDETKALKAKVALSGLSASSNSSSAASGAAITMLKLKNGSEVPVKIHEIPAELASTAGVIRDSCASLISSDPSSYHILLCSSSGAMGIAAGFALDSAAGRVTLTAKQIWQRFESSDVFATATTKLKGGGSAQIAQGLLPTTYASTAPTMMLQARVTHALQSVPPTSAI